MVKSWLSRMESESKNSANTDGVARTGLPISTFMSYLRFDAVKRTEQHSMLSMLNDVVKKGDLTYSM